MGQVAQALLEYRNAERAGRLNNPTVEQQTAASQALADAFDRLIAAGQSPSEEWDESDKRCWFIYMEHSQRMARRMLEAIGNGNGIIDPPVTIHLQSCFWESSNGVLRRINGSPDVLVGAVWADMGGV